jgi:hypothetical protein
MKTPHVGRRRLRRSLTLVVLTGAAALAIASSASAGQVSGTQTLVDQAAGKYEMQGDLVGEFRITSFTEIATEPVFQAEGTEKFKGCLDKNGNGSCGSKDPAGELFFSFRYWAQLAPNDELELATCSHPVTGGKGDFKRTKGILMFVDTPTTTEPFVSTEYEGFLSRKKRRSSHARMGC